MTDKETKYYSTKQLAELLSVHPMTISKWIANGKLDSVKIGKSRRVSADAVAKMIAESTAWADEVKKKLEQH
jgi:excisionase family DNA binding protein